MSTRRLLSRSAVLRADGEKVEVVTKGSLGLTVCRLCPVRELSRWERRGRSKPQRLRGRRRSALLVFRNRWQPTVSPKHPVWRVCQPRQPYSFSEKVDGWKDISKVAHE